MEEEKCGWVNMKEDEPLDWEEKRSCMGFAVKEPHAEIHNVEGNFRCGSCHYLTGDKIFSECPNPDCEVDSAFVKVGLEPPPRGPGYRPWRRKQQEAEFLARKEWSKL